MSKLIDNIKRLAALIKGETKSGGNTAARVGGLFEEMAVELENKYDKTETDRLMTQHDTAGNSHLNVQEMLLQKINDVRETLLAADQGITQELTTHAGTKAIHKTSEEIRAEIVEEDIPETLARVDYVEREKAAILELARQYVTQGIAEVVGGAPDALNALNELAAAINNDPNFAASIMTQLNGKADSVHTHDKSQITDFPSSLPASDVHAWAKQPEKPAYTAAEIGAATRDHNHAGVYQLAGSYAAGTHTHSANEISDTSSKVMMTTSERSKLSGIAAGANNYTHPSTHPASMITEETNKRFMTDAERSKLAGIEQGYQRKGYYLSLIASITVHVQGNQGGYDEDNIHIEEMGSYDRFQINHDLGDLEYKVSFTPQYPCIAGYISEKTENSFELDLELNIGSHMPEINTIWGYLFIYY